MKASVYVDTKVALQDALAASALFSDVQLTYGDPGDLLEQEYLIILDTGGLGEVEEQPWATLGAHAKDETFAVAIAIWAGAPGQTQRQADERALELYAALIDVLSAGDLTLGVAGVIQMEIARAQWYGHPAEHGYATQLDTGIRVTAYLT